MNRLTKFVFTLLVMLFAVSGYAKDVVDIDKTIQITVPKNFSVDALTILKNLNPFTKIGMANEDGEAFITVQATASGGLQTKEAHDLIIRSLAHQGQFNVLSEKIVKVKEADDIDAYLTSFILETLSFKLHYMALDFVINEKQYTAMAWTFPEKFSKYEEDFTKSLMSLKLLK